MATFNVSTGADQSLTIHIIIDDKKATRGLKKVDSGMKQVTKSTKKTTSSFRGFRSIIATMGKALISMMAVLVVFNVLITIPQAIFRALIGTISATIATLADFETRILSLQAIFATTLIFATNDVQNFEIAGRFAVGVVEALTLRASELVTSTQEALIVMQTMLSVGATELVPTYEDMVDLTILLANSIAGVTAGQDRQRQLAEETRSLMTGQFRVTSMLARLIFKSKRDWEKFKQEAKETNNFVGMMTEKLAGFSVAARSLGRTFDGLKTTAQSMLQLFARRAFTNIFDEARLAVAALFDRITADTVQFDRTAAAVSASVRTIFGYYAKWIKEDLGLAFTDANNLMKEIEARAPKAVGFIIRWSHRIRILIHFILGLLEVINLAVSTVIEGFTFLIRLGERVLWSWPFEVRTEETKDMTAEQMNKRWKDAMKDTKSWGKDLWAAVKNLLQIFKLVDSIGIGQKAEKEAIARQVQAWEEIVQQKEHAAELDQLMTGFRQVNLDLMLEENKAQSKINNVLLTQLRNVKSMMRLRTQMGVPQRDTTGVIEGPGESTVLDIVEPTLLGTIDLLVAEQKKTAERINLIQKTLFDAKEVEPITNEISRLRDELEKIPDIPPFTLDIIGTPAEFIASLDWEGARLEIVKAIDIMKADNMYLDIYDPDALEQLRIDLLELTADINKVTESVASTQLEVLRTFDVTFGSMKKRLQDTFMAPIFSAFFADLQKALKGNDTSFKGFRASIGNSIKGVWEFIKSAEFMAMAVVATSSALTDMFKGIGEGTTTATAAMTEFFAGILSGLGEMAIQMGTLWMLEGLLALNFRDVGLGLALIAAGGVAVAVAAKYGAKNQGAGASVGGAAGGTGQVAQFSFDQAAINVQQSASDLSTAAADLNTATSTLESMSAGDVLVKGSEQKGLTNLVARDAKKSRSFTATRNLSLTLAGR